MVEFCPKCGSLLIPVRKGGKIILVCRRCHFQKDVGSSDSYKGVQVISEDKKTKTAVIEEVKTTSKERKERERELLQELYEIVLETMEQEQMESEEE